MQRIRMSDNRKTLPTAIWLTLAVSLIGMTACSNETEDVTLDSDDAVVINKSEEVVETDSSEAAIDNPVSTDGAVDKNKEDNKKTDDTVMINESNENLDKTSAEGLQ